jgi:hemerythrin superfamily protein
MDEENRKYTCKCGKIVSIYSIPSHFDSDKHKQLMELEKKNEFLVNTCLSLKKNKNDLETEINRLRNLK